MIYYDYNSHHCQFECPENLIALTMFHSLQYALQADESIDDG